MRNNLRSLKTFSLKFKDKSKAFSNKMSFYCSKSDHSERNCYFKYSDEKEDIF